ncbi:hypothetical protein GLOTRDRAFT_123728 [Gloeophyllum trabeum ATCC 11539]|uniref:Uncharacterized protein n=1 Tax=Gloeophyllum trabeum (strain ATCC 11539 / FP-39264 / Madison 617) TaxID=670483 RepID=S7QJT8_GLOTA|nr:uncharacterized protein GLOTRDRAFT_123728 [Gloeophyllum trabeum ATCC 11539]EPQ59971.1 hypothetical protein GLOTRDRAFT_123728 [Gloeophyllum trabeum ATCC 11539]
MKQLEALEVIDEVAEYLLPQLATRKRSGQGDHPALFESVKRLKVHLRVTYRPSYLDHDVMIEGAATRIPLVVDALACFLSERQQEGNAIEELHIHAPSFLLSQDEFSQEFEPLVDFTVKTDKLLVARLPHLEEFYMSSYTASACVHVLSHLIIDQPVNLVLKCDLQNILSDRAPSAMNLVSRFLTANRRIVHRFAEIHSHDDIIFTVQRLPSGDDRDPSPSHFRFHDSGRCYPQYWHRYLPLGDVQTLRVHEDMFPHRDLPKGWEIRGLPEKFTSLQQVERLEIVAAVAWYLIPHFATTARSTDPTHPALFPRLKSIRLYLHETRRSWCAPENIPALCEDVFGVLESYLRERHEEGHPIEELGIHAPSGIIQSDELNARFRNLVCHLRFPYSPMETSCLLWKCDLCRFS